MPTLSRSAENEPFRVYTPASLGAAIRHYRKQAGLSQAFMSEDGWPYPDDDDVDEQLEPIDLRAETDDDLVALHALPRHVVLDLTSTERTVIALRYGFDGRRPSTLSELHRDLGMSRREIREILLDGLTKLRTNMTAL